MDDPACYRTPPTPRGAAARLPSTLTWPGLPITSSPAIH
jgi:hypothetical protein